MAQKVTLQDVTAEIAGEQFLFPEGGITTICVLTLKNGHQVVGAVFGQEFSREIGMQEARRKAVAEIWPLLVFRARG